MKSFNLHSEILFSIKSSTQDLLIGDAEWDFIFEFYQHSSEVYFMGNRLQFGYPEINKDVGFLSEKLITSQHNNFDLLLKVRPINLLFNRNLLEKFWLNYEYPAVIFIKNKIREEHLIDY